MVINRKIATIPTWRVDIGRIRLFATHLAMGAKGKGKDMWDSDSPTHHICDATTKKGKDCQGIAHVAIWCHRFESWTSEKIGPYGHSYSTGPSWWDVCNVHQSVPQGYVSAMPYPMVRK
jgi:hypothetical protein